jgi:hypothetical protein
VKFVVDEVILRKGVLSFSFGFPLIIVILPFIHTHLSPLPELCDSPDQAAQYHILKILCRTCVFLIEQVSIDGSVMEL